MDLEKIKEEYDKGANSEITGITREEWAVMELVRLWMSEGIGKKSSKIKGTTPRRMNVHIKAMLNKLEKHWFEFLELIESNDKERFRIVIKKNIPELYKVWNDN
ncbi:hypothetical protein KAR91_55925 [Candidatus Pacearchaeota archaeon]|nr:hypothetical protein [Candidatus Pacearchaeota archaeon]